MPAREVFTIRPMCEDDIAFVMDSWMRSAWNAENTKLRKTHNRKQREKAGRAWFDAIRPKVRALLEDRKTTVLVAVCKEDPDHIAAWVAIRDGREMRSHIKHAYRGFGVDRMLKDAMDATVQAHRTQENA